MTEVVENQQDHKEGSDSETLQSDSAETSSFTVNSNQSVLDTSILLLHSYCGYIDTSTLSRPKNQFKQTDVLQNESVGIQTSEVKVTVKCLNIIMFLQILHVIKQQIQPLYPF